MSVASSPKSLREKQREEREFLILQAAETLLFEKGFYEMSMDEIAAHVGIAKGTVYLHFGSKDELVVALFERNLNEFHAGLAGVIATPGTASERLVALLRYVYSMMYNERFCSFRTVFESPEMRSRFAAKKQDGFRERWDALTQGIEDILEEGKASGEFDATVPTPVMLSLFLGVFSPQNHERLIGRAKIPLDDLVAQLSYVLFHGIAAKLPPTER